MPPAAKELPAEPLAAATAGPRLVSLDALRGFSMFWLIGGSELFIAFAALFSPEAGNMADTLTTHRRWHGYLPWDLVMPLFLFMVGTSLPFAQAKRTELGVPLKTTYWRIARRVVVLWICGIVIQTKLLSPVDPPGVELYSNALQAIAIGYLVTSMALLHLPLSGQIALFAALTLGYWALMAFVPFGGHPAGTLLPTINLPRYIDDLLLGNYRRDHNFTWVLSSLGFAASVLLGSLSGHLLRGKQSAAHKTWALVALGLICLAVGWVWSYWLPLNRHLWTSSMILWSGGWSFLLLALFYWVIDVAGYKRWAFFLVVIGVNALLAYVLDQFFMIHILDRFFGQMSSNAAGGLTPNHPLLVHCKDLFRAVSELGLLWLLLWYFYRKRIFLRA